ncbi:MAG: hypothetical protein ACTSWX_06980 [Promethearchaeota archaeon]
MLIVFQFLNPYLQLLSNKEITSNNDMSYIESDLKDLSNAIEKFHKSEEIIANFSYPGKISLIIEEKENEFITLLFRFSWNKVIYKEFQVDSSFQIEIRSVFINEYCLQFVNNSDFIIFS